MKKIFAIRDRVANDLLTMQMYTLMTFKTNEQAARYFADAILDKSSVLNRHPGDYELLYLGTVDDNGYLIPNTPDPALVLTGDTLIALQKPELVKEA